jgi:hypothetical protein
VAAWAEILQPRRHSPNTQPLKIHIHSVRHHRQRSSLTFD